MSLVTLNVFTLLQHFVGNHNGETITSNSLCPDLTARVLRFYPIAWNTTIAMRVGVAASKNGKLCYVYVTAFFVVCFGNLRWTSKNSNISQNLSDWILFFTSLVPALRRPELRNLCTHLPSEYLVLLTFISFYYSRELFGLLLLTQWNDHS